MARYSDEIIDDVRQSNDIVDVISQYVRLKRSGRNYFGLCPFHNEKSPSFSVSPEKQIFHCFGCGVGGNVFTFLTKIEGINFVEAVQLLAERANIQLPTLENNVDSAKEALKAKVYKENEFTVAGPGSLRGINKCFIDKGNMSNEDIIKYMYENQDKEFKRLNLNFKRIGNRELQLIDCQNIFCELDKYCRQALPELKSNRKKIKKKYIPKTSKIEYMYPPKWKVELY